jgi:hypothetical protein
MATVRKGHLVMLAGSGVGYSWEGALFHSQ